MKRHFSLHLSLALAFLFVFTTESFATDKRPKGGSLTCPVNASAGKRATTHTTHIRKKGKPAKAKPAKKVSTQRSKPAKVNTPSSKPAKANTPRTKASKPAKQKVSRDISKQSDRQSQPKAKTKSRSQSKGRSYGGGRGGRHRQTSVNYKN